VLSPHFTQAKITGLTPGRRYTFRVAALNHRGLGPASDPSNAITAAKPNTSFAAFDWIL